tara:strand:- start:213 stop:422 length:210 start_codon:yes stop_codon:yes gene_type:complete
MITQEVIYRFFETLSLKFLKENIPILNNLIHDYEDYPSIDDLEKNYTSGNKDDKEEIDDKETILNDDEN